MDNLEHGLIPTGDDKGEALGQMLNAILSPIIHPLVEMLRNNTEAIQNIAAQQKVQSDRMEALERQMRLNTPVTSSQVRYINDAIRKRARELLSKSNLDTDAAAVKKLTAAIRKAVLTRQGTASMHDVPRHEYSVVIQQVETWNDFIVLLDITRGAKKAAESRGIFPDMDTSGLIEEDSHG